MRVMPPHHRRGVELARWRTGSDPRAHPRERRRHRCAAGRTRRAARQLQRRARNARARAAWRARVDSERAARVRSRLTRDDQEQVWRLSSVSALCIVALLLAVYRSLTVLAMTLVPVASGALAGVTAVALGFPAVHGLTLGFGVTLIGESVDYGIYFFINERATFAAQSGRPSGSEFSPRSVASPSCCPLPLPGSRSLGCIPLPGSAPQRW
jgi:hypothetical protein